MNKFSPHLSIAKNYWKDFLKKNYIVIDATCGNGYDSLFISQILLEPLNGKLYCFDIQKKAIENTQNLLKNNLKTSLFEKICFINDSHEDFSKYVKNNINLIIYNLGYLPNSNKILTTTVNTTLLSLKSALNILDSNGAISITSYSGHEEGEKEEKALISFLSTLNFTKYSVCFHKWINKEKAPSFFWIRQKTN
jgi:tRNA G37 N-methylase Trm5